MMKVDIHHEGKRDFTHLTKSLQMIISALGDDQSTVLAKTEQDDEVREKVT